MNSITAKPQVIRLNDSNDGLPPILNIEQAAKVCQVSNNKMYDMTRRAGFPAYRDGNRIMIPRDAMLRWIEQRALENTGESCRELVR